MKIFFPLIFLLFFLSGRLNSSPDTELVSFLSKKAVPLNDHGDLDDLIKIAGCYYFYQGNQCAETCEVIR